MAMELSKRSKVGIVPWYNMEEWQEVYKQIYSDDVKEQTKGLEHLLLWKARCPQSIPVGAQCTLDLLQICLRDKSIAVHIANGKLPAYYEYELCLMYSVTLMRFINHIATLAEHQMSLYAIAQKLNIPDWLVNIRHDTAHSQNLPPLCVLREAAQFCLKWMNEHYWQNEAEMTQDWIVNEDDSVHYPHLSHQLKNIFEMWQAVMLYSKAGLRSIKEISDPKLVKHLCEQKKKYSRDKLKRMKKIAQKKYLLKNDELTSAQLLLLKELKKCLQQSSSCINKNNLIVDLLLAGEGFLASPDFLAVFNSNFDVWRLQNDSFPLYFLSLWEGMLNFLQQHKVIPLLLHKLIEITYNERESPHRSRMAALWIKEFGLALLKVHKSQDLVEMLENQKQNKVNIRSKMTLNLKSKPKSSTEELFKQAMKQVEEDWPDFKQVISLTIQDVPNIFTTLEFVKNLVLHPNKWTPIFLPSLLELVDPALPQEMKDNIILLVSLYVQEVNNLDIIFNINALEIHSTAEFHEETGSVPLVSENMNCAVLQMENLLPQWQQSEANVEWSKCPFGVLPWQRGLLELATQLPNNSTWQPLKPTISMEKQFHSHHPTISKKTLDWNFIMQKTPKKRQPLSHNNVYESVCIATN